MHQRREEEEAQRQQLMLEEYESMLAAKKHHEEGLAEAFRLKENTKKELENAAMINDEEEKLAAEIRAHQAEFAARALAASQKEEEEAVMIKEYAAVIEEKLISEYEEISVSSPIVAKEVTESREESATNNNAEDALVKTNISCNEFKNEVQDGIQSSFLPTRNERERLSTFTSVNVDDLDWGSFDAIRSPAPGDSNSQWDIVVTPIGKSRANSPERWKDYPPSPKPPLESNIVNQFSSILDIQALLEAVSNGVIPGGASNILKDVYNVENIPTSIPNSRQKLCQPLNFQNSAAVDNTTFQSSYFAKRVKDYTTAGGISPSLARSNVTASKSSNTFNPEVLQSLPRTSKSIPPQTIHICYNTFHT